MRNNIQELNEGDLESVSGAVAPLAIVFAVYTFTTPIFAAGVAVGVQEAVEGQQ